MSNSQHTRADILELAKASITGRRAEDYGRPEDNFGCIAALWSDYTGHAYTAVDVAVMMILLKVARVRSDHGGIDSYVDIAGYAACAGEIASRTNN